MSKSRNSKEINLEPVDEPLKPIRFEELRSYAPTPEAKEENIIPIEAPFLKPQTAKDWANLAKILKSTTPEQYPAVKPADFVAFKKAVLYAKSDVEFIKWSFIGILPSAFFILTESILHIAQWGAIFWFGGAAFIILMEVIGGSANQSLKQQAQELGLNLRLFKRS